MWLHHGEHYKGNHSRQLTLKLGYGPRSRGDIQVKIYLPTQVTIY